MVRSHSMYTFDKIKAQRKKTLFILKLLIFNVNIIEHLFHNIFRYLSNS